MNNRIIIILLLVVLISCNSNKTFDQFKTIKDNEWLSENKIEFTIVNQDTISPKNVFINIRNNKDYEFSTLFLIAKIEFPKGTKIVDTLEYEMTDEAGKWLGSGYTDIKENKLFYKENVTFSEIGNYKFSIQHATRSINDIYGEKPLKGITNVGLSIENINE